MLAYFGILLMTRGNSHLRCKEYENWEKKDFPCYAVSATEMESSLTEKECLRNFASEKK